MNERFEQIERNFENNIKDVLSLLKFDQVVLEFAISGIRKLHDTHVQRGTQSPKLNGQNVLQMLENIGENDSLKPQYRVMYNQCAVLLVSIFASAIADLFRSAINLQSQSGPGERLADEEIKLSVRELHEFKYDLTGRIGRVIEGKQGVSFQDMKSISRAFRTYFDINIDKDAHVNNIVLVQACRHSIVHDASICNDRVLRQVKNANPRDVKTYMPAEGAVIEFTIEELQATSESMVQYFKKVKMQVLDTFDET